MKETWRQRESNHREEPAIHNGRRRGGVQQWWREMGRCPSTTVLLQAATADFHAPANLEFQQPAGLRDRGRRFGTFLVRYTDVDMRSWIRAVHEAGHAVVGIEMGFRLIRVTLRKTIGDSGVPIDGFCWYQWSGTRRIYPTSCARARAMTVFAGVLAESAVLARRNAWKNFGCETDDRDKLAEILTVAGLSEQADADRWQCITWEKSRRLVIRKRAHILRVAKALLKRKSLSGCDVEVLLSPRIHLGGRAIRS